MITIHIEPSAAGEEVVTWPHDRECLEDDSARSVCEGMYIDRVNDIIELCAALRAVYALAGESAQVRDIVEKAIKEHGGPE